MKKILNKLAGLMMMNAAPFMGGLIVGIIVGVILMYFALSNGIMVDMFCPGK